MIAQVVFDLPLEGPFDYAVPPEFEAGIAVGQRVSVVLGHASSIGYVAGLADTSAIKNLKPIRAILDVSPVIDDPLQQLARRMEAAYGCSLGQAIGLMVPRLLRAGRRMEKVWPGHVLDPRQKLSGMTSGDDSFWIDSVHKTLDQKRTAIVLAPDVFAMERLHPLLQTAFVGVPILFHQPRTPKEELDQWTRTRSGEFRIVVGTRSAVFTPLLDMGLVVMTDEGDPSYREEQTPFYEARDVALMRAQIEGAQVVATGPTPSVEIWHALGAGTPAAAASGAEIQIVDLSNYKYLEKGMISLVLRSRLEEALNAKAQSVLVLNRRGLYAVTRCMECALVLSCPRCSSAMTFSRAGKQYVCPHCPSVMPPDTPCPKCQKPNWRSFGMGVEKIQSELNILFPQAKVVTFERGDSDLPDGDILIATQAVLRFKDRLKPRLAALVDMDSELNRLDMRSSYRSWALAVHLRAMAQKTLIVQTRNSTHHVLRALAADDARIFYDEEIRLRKELGFSPFAHWAAVTVRARQEKSAMSFARDVYNVLVAVSGQGMQILEPGPGIPAKMRGQYRFKVLVQGPRAEDITAVIKAALAKVKRSGRLIVTVEVDP
ncbi:MAG: primosomal protein N' [Candidatus Omnitrophota bacterium]|nr:primosomal protein N' [Candidatus Omnitrophota bacterium]